MKLFLRWGNPYNRPVFTHRNCPPQRSVCLQAGLRTCEFINLTGVTFPCLRTVASLFAVLSLTVAGAVPDFNRLPVSLWQRR